MTTTQNDLTHGQRRISARRTAPGTTGALVAAALTVVLLATGTTAEPPVAVPNYLGADGRLHFGEPITTQVSIDLLAFVADADGERLEILSGSTVTHGELLERPDGTVSYTPPTDYCGGAVLGFTARDESGGQTGLQLVLTIRTAASCGGPTTERVPMAVVGQTSLSSAPRVVDYSVDGVIFAEPVVFIEPPEDDAAPASVVTVRVSAVTGTTFTARLEAPNGAVLPIETVDYVVVDAGRWQVVPGVIVEAGRITSDRTARFSELHELSAPINSAPSTLPESQVLLTQVQSRNSTRWVHTRALTVPRDLSTKPIRFHVALEGELRDVGHPTAETMGWMLMPDLGGIAWGTDGPLFDAGSDDCAPDPAGRCSLAFASGFTSPPNLVAWMSSYEANAATSVAEPSVLRRTSVAGTGADFAYQLEPAPFTAQEVAYLAVEGSGVLLGSPLNRPPRALNVLRTVTAGSIATFPVDGIDPEGAALAVKVCDPSCGAPLNQSTGQPASGPLTVTADAGSFIFDATGISSGVFSYRYRAVDAGGMMSDWASLTVQVTTPTVVDAVDDGPFRTDAGDSLPIGYAGLLANDLPAGAVLVTFGQPSLGTLELRGTGLIYNAPASVGATRATDAFTYTIADPADDANRDTATITVHVDPPLGASFIGHGCVATSCDFTAQATVTGSTFAWDFGDGNTAQTTTGSVMHVYGAAGLYVVSVTATDPLGRSAVDELPITVGSPPVASIAPVLCKGPTCTFDGSGSSDDGQIVAYLWNFGDGSTASGPIVQHTFAAAGLYVVTLTVTDDEGATDSAQRGVPIVLPPIAAFTVPPCDGLTCSFDASASSDDGQIESYDWDFGDGTLATTTDPLFTHTYAAADTYTVVLTVTDNQNATGSTQQQVPVVLPPVPRIELDCTDLTCSFDGSSSTDDRLIESYDWQFGDGEVASGVSVGHTYDDEGAFTVTLTVTDDQGATASTQRQVEVEDELLFFLLLLE